MRSHKQQYLPPSQKPPLEPYIVALPFMQSGVFLVICLIVTIAGLHAKESLLIYAGMTLGFASVIISFWQFSRLYK